MLLTVTFHFRLLVNSEEITALGMQLREHLIVDYATMARSARQWIFTIVETQRELEGTVSRKVSDGEIADYINNNINVAEDPNVEKDDKDDKNSVSENFVKSCLDVHRSLLADKTTAKLIEDADGEWGLSSPLNAIAKLHVIAKQCKSEPEWVVMSIIDAVKSGLHPTSVFGHRALKGEGHNKGFVELFLFKSKLRKYLLGDFLHERVFPVPIKDKLKHVYENHVSFRCECPFNTETRQWQIGWESSGVHMATLIEETVFGKDADASFRRLNNMIGSVARWTWSTFRQGCRLSADLPVLSADLPVLSGESNSSPAERMLPVRTWTRASGMPSARRKISEKPLRWRSSSSTSCRSTKLFSRRPLTPPRNKVLPKKTLPEKGRRKRLGKSTRSSQW